MKAIPIGLDADGIPISVTPKMRASTHMHVIGGSGKGKSKFLEGMIRKDIREAHGLCLIDWHGTLYKEVLNYCYQLGVGVGKDDRSLTLLNPSKPDFITGFNPFVKHTEDISVQVNNMTLATLTPWGAKDTDQTPLLARVLRVAYTVAAELQMPLWNVQKLLRYGNSHLREFAIRILSDSLIREDLQQFQQMNQRDWAQFVLSTENRLSRFLGSKGVRRFMNLTEGNIDLRDIMDNQEILLVNLGASEYLDRESAKLFASLFLNEFFQTAMLRANEAPPGEKPKTFVLYLDEFQEYITDDIAAMLEQVRKGGLHIVLAHQNLGQLLNDEHLLEALLGSARLRVVFGGLSYNTASFLGNEMFLRDLNDRQIKKAYYHTTHLYREETRTSTARSHGRAQSKSSSVTRSSGSAISRGSSVGEGHSSSSVHASGYSSGTGTSSSRGQSLPGSQMTVFTPFTEGWFSESEASNQVSSSTESDIHSDSQSSSYSESYSETSSKSFSRGISKGSSAFQATGETELPVWVPIPVQELASEAEWSREEKLSKVAETLMTQQDQTAFIKLDEERTQPLLVPFVRTRFLSPEYLLEYEQALYQAQGALSADQADQQITVAEQRFLTTAREALNIEPTIDRQSIKLAEATVEIARPKKRAGRKKAPANLFDSIKRKEE